MAFQGGPDSFGGVLETGGFDTVHAGYSGQWDRDKFKRFAEQADDLQELALKGAEHLAVMHLDSGDTWNFKAFGRNEGCNYRWCVDWNGNDLLIMNRAEACETFPHFRLQMKSVPLMNHGPYRLHRWMVEHLTDLGFKFTEELLGRVDGCVDMPGQDPRDFVRLLVNDHQVTKLKEGAIYFSNNVGASTGFAIGSKASGEVGVYDKLKDLEKKGDLVKQDILVQRRWGGVLPTLATRIEFRTGRKLLAKTLINTVEQLKTWGWPIMEYFGTKVFRLNANPANREAKHLHRDEVHPLWAKVMAMFEAWARRVDEPVPVLVKRSAVQPQADRLSAIGMGCLESMFAKEGRHFETDDDYIQAVAEHAAQNAHESRRTVDLRREQMNRRAAGVLMPLVPTPF